MTKNKYVVYFLLTVLSFILITDSPRAIAASKNLKIMMINWRVEKEASKGFKDGLEELGYDVKYDEFVAQQKSENLYNFLKSNFNPKNYDYIYTFGTSASKIMQSIIKDVTPQIFTGVFFPVKSGLVKSFDKPGKNCSGATHFVPVELQIKTALELFKFKKLLMPYNPKEQNSCITKNKVAKLSKKYKFNFESIRIDSKTTLKEFIKKLQKKEIRTDIVYLPPDSMITTNIDSIVKTFLDTKQLNFTALKRNVDKGALLGFANEYYKVGQSAASILDENQKGTPLKDIPVIKFDNPTIYVNKKTADAFNFKIPEAFINRIEYTDN